MSYYNQGYQSSSPAPANLNFYQSNYGPGVSGHTTPSQASYGQYPAGNTSAAYPAYGSGVAAGFGQVSGRMGEQGGLRTGWLAAFSTEGYEGEPGLMEELGVNFGHIKTKVSSECSTHCRRHTRQDLVPSEPAARCQRQFVADEMPLCCKSVIKPVCLARLTLLSSTSHQPSFQHSSQTSSTPHF